MPLPSPLPSPLPLLSSTSGSALHELTSLHVALPALPLPHVVADLEDLARRVDRIADEVRRTEERLRRHAASVAWESAAATAYQHRAAAHAAGLARCTYLVEDVAADLRHHAVVVRERGDAVRRAAETVGHTVTDALRQFL